MKRLLLAGILLLVAKAGAAKATMVTPLLAQDLAGISGREGAMLTVEYPPGTDGPVQRRNAHAFAYGLEGAAVMQVQGGAPVTLHPGQAVYEEPGDIHALARNASTTEPAKFLAVLVKDKGAPALEAVR